MERRPGTGKEVVVKTKIGPNLATSKRRKKASTVVCQLSLERDHALLSIVVYITYDLDHLGL